MHWLPIVIQGTYFKISLNFFIHAVVSFCEDVGLGEFADHPNSQPTGVSGRSQKTKVPGTPVVVVARKSAPARPAAVGSEAANKNGKQRVLYNVTLISFCIYFFHFADQFLCIQRSRQLWRLGWKPPWQSRPQRSDSNPQIK